MERIVIRIRLQGSQAPTELGIDAKNLGYEFRKKDLKLFNSAFVDVVGQFRVAVWKG